MLSHERRTFSPELKDRLDKHEEIIIETRDMVIRHLEADKSSKESMDELILLWKGSKVVLPILVAAASAIGGLLAWIKMYIK